MTPEEEALLSEKLPPYSAEAEMAILGCILSDSAAAMPECLLRLKPGGEVFYDLRHKRVYDTCLELYEDNTPADVVTVFERLKTWGQVEEIGGAGFIASLLTAASLESSLIHYLEIVLQKYLLRKMIRVCIETSQEAHSLSGNAPDFLDRFESRVLAIRDDTRSSAEFCNIRQLREELATDYQAACDSQLPVGIVTDFRDLDRMCGGMVEQEMIVLAGAPSAGKTTLAMNIACKVAARGIGVAVISLETAGKKMLHRMACSIGHYSGSALFRGQATAEDAASAISAMDTIVSWENNLWISDEGAMTPDRLGAKCRRAVQQGAKLIVVDYLQLLECAGKSEYEKATNASKAIKNLAKDLKVPVIVVSSLNRESAKANRKPTMADLRASGQIEYDADKIWLLHCENPESDIRKVEVNVAKQKEGSRGPIGITFFAPEFRMESATRAPGDESAAESEAEAEQHHEEQPEFQAHNDP